MTDDVVWHYAAAIAPPARGKAEVCAFIEAFGATIGEVRAHLPPFRNGRQAVRRGVDEYTSLDGIDIAAPYAGVIEFRGDKISGWRDYVDRERSIVRRPGKAGQNMSANWSGGLRRPRRTSPRRPRTGDAPFATLNSLPSTSIYRG